MTNTPFLVITLLFSYDSKIKMQNQYVYAFLLLHLEIYYRNTDNHPHTHIHKHARTHKRMTPTHKLTCVIVKAGGVEFAHVELQTDDGEHEDSEEQE